MIKLENAHIAYQSMYNFPQMELSAIQEFRDATSTEKIMNVPRVFLDTNTIVETNHALTALHCLMTMDAALVARKSVLDVLVLLTGITLNTNAN